MRTFILFLILGIVPLLNRAQFFVVKVNEQVYADGKLLEPRAKVASDAQLSFSSNKAYAHVLSTSKGHFVLSGEKSRKNRKGEFLSALKEAIIPSDQFQAAATRTIATEKDDAVWFEDKYDMKAYFRETIVLLDTASFRVNPDRFPLDEDHFFTISHQLENTRITRHLEAEKDIFSLATSILYDEEGNKLDKEIQSTALIYNNKVKNEQQEFGPFKIKLLDEAEKKTVKNELTYLWQLLSPDSEGEFIQLHALPYLYGYYGKLRMADVRKIMK